MDIGTAKTTEAEQTLVAHHLLNVVEPNEKFSGTAEFKRLAEKVFTTFYSKGKYQL